MQQLSSIVLTQALCAYKNWDFAENTFAATISALLSLAPAEHRSSTASIRKARLNFVIERLSPIEDIPAMLEELPWHELDRVVEALGWVASNSKKVAAHSSSSEDYSIEVHITVAGKDLPNVTFIQAQDVIRSTLSPRTKKLLRILSSKYTGSSGCSVRDSS
ncbi:uncharacterized protein PHACADRAFT_259740 [Phanerochaete carnosa HHB-10118-sp]|uniref:Uncharacterized protein n=1 Tax=Phanerochaete carnosa (strain HHB-10118-sp) TaxID=650164 RepID=K5W3A0_PHACS|nr:uncharacterized protein PHACADRAFT_259740 [Phanerochaete carnosa HHB-10118-sp]EKM53389.1 hypothetical protein PHACADRAFT_259740 [Phanerochaete carnosa HHB-10118-sp]